MPNAHISKRRALFWNAAGSTANALQSFVLLIAVQRICGSEIAGDYSVAYALAQVLWTVGVFEATTFFATDAANRFTPEQYLAFKTCSCLLMLICGVGYTLIRGLAPFAAYLTVALCLFRLVDAFHDFFYALYQKNERLDLSGFSVFCQTCLSTVFFIVLLLLSKDILMSICIVVAGKTLFYIVFDRSVTARLFPIGAPDYAPRPLAELLQSLFPLFLAAFCSSYVANITKFAIEHSAVASQQAVYNILFMPSFAINLLVLFFLRPTLTTLASLWQERDFKAFKATISRLLLGVLAVALFVEAVAALAGIPVLELIYGVDLSGMTPCLLVLLVGSALASASAVFYNVFIVMRKQRTVMAIYLVVALICYPISSALVGVFGLMGAAYSYVVVYGIMFALMIGAFAGSLARSARAKA